MKLFCMLLVVGVAFGIEHPNSGHGLTIDRIRERTEGLENDLKDVAEIVADTLTLCAVDEEELNEINDFNIPMLDVKNKQHNELMESYRGQIKEMQHKVDAAKAVEKEAITIASRTADQLDTQINDYLNGSVILDKDVQQEMSITSLKSVLTKCKREFLDKLSSTVDGLNQRETATRNLISDLGVDVADKKCEYGSGIFPVNQPTTVSFKTQFNEVPAVSFSLSGFHAHLDLPSHSGYGAHSMLALDAFAENVTTAGFVIPAIDKSNGGVEIKYLSGNYMACQFPDNNV